MEKYLSQFILLSQNIPKILSIFKLISRNTDNLQGEEDKIAFERGVGILFLGFHTERKFCNFLIYNN